MDIQSIVLAAGLIGGMGLLFGALLAVVDRIFRVEENPKEALVRAHLPGANCGGCGRSGCDAFARALAEGSADVDACAVASKDAARAIGEILGRQVKFADRKVAFVRCRGSIDKCSVNFEYRGVTTCRAAEIASGGDKACRFSCLGYGDCARVCKFGALRLTDGRLVDVIEEKCIGCGACVKTCPRSIIVLTPYKRAVQSACSAMAKGKLVRENCAAGCIGCGKCAKVCEVDAIAMVNDLPVIDYKKCVGCLKCAQSCPTGALQAVRE